MSRYVAVAYGLLPELGWTSLVWLWLGNPIDGTRNVYVLLPQVAALARFAADVDGRLTTLGMEGLTGALDLHKKLRAVLDPISTADLEAARTAVADLTRKLTETSDQIAALRRLKETLE
jgi:hypothetical protein